ncbi:MAG TPA: bifunctional adenosylcobinamide kinase/adenosylcobinamide-phosphate guanylyltransferase [Polyangiaceae bacterium]|nr:bifunctional adenosylcobinamide kinase/adenosylcobinamide-phosphate guanylyltransferase [Polyangiaceae bacterium]
MLTLILGGARSGKSSFAARLALSLSPSPVYVATAQVGDEDFAARVRRHQADRGPEWTTIEEPRALGSLELEGRVVVVDCATLWLSNFFGDFAQDIEKTLGAANSELDLLLARNNRYFIVSNEVGLSLHAQTEIGRRFVDLQGFFNQELARRARTVAFMVAGIPWLVKGALPSPAEGP